ncbi:MULTISPECIES: DNA mismatch repair protein MutS [unclassified Lacticaseibacillus]|uniref:MutS-related protein n=1 Tax=unclassified Lacticaseibacillus TaxID=2759744 RepID=UPI0019410E46|nr:MULTISPECIES: DNA mismatch repair protein MutS [unclassified Lacticaseibacillus]
MTLENWLWVLAFVAVLIAVAVISAVHAHIALRNRLLRSWGELPERTSRDSEDSLKEAYLASSKLRPTTSVVDDLTWHDLDLMHVFRLLNQTESSVGAEALYAKLRGFDLGQPNVDEQLIAFFAGDQVARMKVRTAFARLGKLDHNQSQNYLLSTTSGVLANVWRYRLLGLLPLFGLLLALILPFAGLLVTIGSLIFNVIYYELKKEALTLELNAMRYLVQTITTAGALVKVTTPKQAALQQALRPLAGISRHAFTFRAKSGSMADLITDYISFMFMLPFIAYNYVLRTLRLNKQAALDLWAVMGDLEVAIAIANFRLAMPGTCTPTFKDGGVSATALRHPLLDAAVPNDVSWHQTALITGSNASGKSTYVKSVAINLLLAQTINTATAKTFACTPGHVVTAMAVQDDIAAGDSYFIAEIKAIQRLLNLVAKGERVYGFIDEILKGTNTVERIAASAAVVQWLNQTNALTMVATHDSELSGILAGQVVDWHFQETVDQAGVHFDYRLRQGPATSHNAIALLQAMHYPASITEEAQRLAHAFEQSRTWPTL